MEHTMEVPAHRLAKHAVPAFRWGSAIGHVIMLAIIGIFFAVSIYFSWGQWSRWIVWIAVALMLISGIWSIGFRPFYVHKHFRYGFSDEFLQIKSGAFYETHELIPMTKIQAVSTNQGPILRKFGLYSLTIETMGSSHEIPALPKEVAVDVRNQIALYAKIREVDE
ncbi:PH domain-containing protein [Sporosarcina aquimarina]|uniref:PH domain-containing protein n=1 Tax=Sporosarcina aquimarina TaxID=114975 RepID=A0ABU4FX91_9BACL|nr:PH domain-containing protein [Sporosarcina aquimarina]MDW0108752.1 PH domain-containing protein [Sporosarcina aquimarina]